MGRPRKYRSSKALDAAVESYFASISRTVSAQEKYNTGKKDNWGHKIFKLRPILNDAGEEIRYVEYAVPPTVGGLCEHLGIHRSTWSEYCDAGKHPQFSDTATRARGRIRAWLERELLTRRDVRGIIFDLQNNHGYAERREVELGPNAGKALSAASLPVTERREALAEIAREYGGGNDGCEDS